MAVATPPHIVEAIAARYRAGETYAEIRAGVAKDHGAKLTDAVIAKYATRAGLTGKRSTSPRRKKHEAREAREHEQRAGDRWAPPAPDEASPATRSSTSTSTKEGTMPDETPAGKTGHAMKARCSGCSAVLGIPKDEVGKTIECPSCGTKLWATAP